MKFLTRTIWILSLVSLLTDMASEMLYPIMPLFLTGIGFSVLLIGVLEGFAEAVAGVSKGYFGELSDRYRKRVPFIQLGYAMSAVSKPMMALFTFPWWIFAARTLDRLGKGLRTAPRDAMLSGESAPGAKGKVFGFHRGMDTLGAVVGPVAALIYLQFYPGDYSTLFIIAFLPGMMAVLLSLILKDAPAKEGTAGGTVTFFSSLRYWRRSGSGYKWLAAGLLFFALFNSSDAFLLLQAKQSGIADSGVIGLYIFYNLIYALLAFPAGVIADRIGLRKMLMAGLVFFAAVYAGMASGGGIYYFGFLFFLYGAYAAATEGISKAWISSVCSEGDKATALGLFTGLQSVSILIASSAAGIVWHYFGAVYVFAISAAASIMAVLYFILSRSRLPESLRQEGPAASKEITL